ncbi:zinc finger and BTB domain-containing protein 41-like [Parasteatoda tepidariorum]|uniref:zinc finger and BTB domain-containing protein 41-like n=1 Tax=Parasteatoda tepidariorum TaxID=114398 RepID=UPI00077FC51E|nr:uncharacterized protein LOC107436218 [Parasteatoda tepidariorum]XP_015903328.1 uncharacterized protein LOC107436218 [Parasteatoda tepidariorum]XP_042899550.1 uncharacterized protein LOC107436218 [Parasteatoda tepidariorum]
MSVEGECESKLASVSPNMQSDASTDGDASITLNTFISIDKSSPVPQDAAVSCEPKAKKRRKQSNPLKIQNAPPSPKFDLSAYEMVDQSESINNQNTYDFEESVLNQNQSYLTDKNKGTEPTSQKGTLSRVTNALLNNKVKEAARISSKSKESSLQSLTDLSSPESGEDVVSNEYKNPTQNIYPNISSLATYNPVDIANDATKIANIYNFSDFSSPLQQGNINLSVSQRSFVTSSGVRVFNPEAYCELCEKEFCNKYFLKTHKANKHGICSNESSPSAYGGQRLSYKNMHLNPQAAQQMITQMCETGATFGSADSYCNICQKYFCNKYFLKKHRQNIHGLFDDVNPNIPSSIHVPVISSPLPLIRSVSQESKSTDNSTGNITKDEDSLNVSIENIKNSLNCSLPLLNGSSPHTSQNKNTNSINSKEKKTEKFLCELCNIEFCEKCYLDAHMINKHVSAKLMSNEFPEFSEVGKVETSEKVSHTDETDESKEFKGQMCTPCMKNFTSAESFQNHMLEVHGASLKEEEDVSLDLASQRNGPNLENGSLVPHEKSLKEMDNSNDSVTYSCNLCFQKYKDQKSFLTHAESDHGIVGNAAIEASNLVCDACPEQFSDRIALLSHKFKAHGIIPPGLETHIDNGDSEYIYYQGLRHKSSGSSFCQICNKELCNKYFMKTHMLKMHGIDVDKALIERWPASTGGVYCDICQKFLCSKYFLKVHKQNVHGIVDESTKMLTASDNPSCGSTLSMNDKKLPTNLSQATKMNNTSKESLGNDDFISKRSNGSTLSCEICGQVFYDKLALQVHLVNKHVKCNDSKAFPNLLSQSEDSKEALTAGILPCPCCSFVNLEDNEKHSPINSLENKMISCIVCSITYYQNDYHTHHLSHGTSLPIGKKMPNFENGTHDDSANGFDLSGNNNEVSTKNSLRPKLKRFRCSKCDKTFRTKTKCLHHIQVMHKVKKGLSNQCDSQSPSKKAMLNHSFRKVDHKGPENGTSSLCTKETDERAALLSSGLPEGAPLPVPYYLPTNSDVIMQPFHLTEPKPDEATKQNIFVPAMVFLPVSQKVSEKLTVAFTLTPA